VHELGNAPGLRHESPSKVGSFESLRFGAFERDHAPELEVPGPVHNPHASSTDLLEEVECPDTPNLETIRRRNDII